MAADHPEANVERRVAVVTGAASGIGRATARRLMDDGFRVLAVDCDAEGLDRLADDCGATGECATYVADLGVAPEIPGVVDSALHRWGRIDVLALVAGIGQMGPAERITVDEWDRVMSINLRGPFLLAQQAMPHLVNVKGTVIAVSSVAGLQGWPYAAAYSASKGGLVTLMKSLAIEFGPVGVRVNVVAPGSVVTALAAGMHAQDFEYNESLRKRVGGLDGRRAQPDEIAAVIAFLGSEAASFVNGAVIQADGGAFA